MFGFIYSNPVFVVNMFGRAIVRFRIFQPLFFVTVLISTLFCGCVERQLSNCTPQMDAALDYWVKVLLFDGAEKSSFECDSAVLIANDKDGSMRRWEGGKGAAIEIRLRNGLIEAGEYCSGPSIRFLPEAPHIFRLNGKEYRGNLRLVLSGAGDGFGAVNFVPVEPYLAGVVGAEMPDYWENEALKAQAIASRTYCLYMKNKFGGKRYWDVRSDQSSQVYLGVKAESKRVWDAVNKTYGKVLHCRGKDGREDIFPAYYSSTCGGHTEDSRHVFGGEEFESLCGVDCPYCRHVAKPKFFYWPMVQYDKNDVTVKVLSKYPSLKKLGKIDNIVVHKKSDYGRFSRLTSLRLVGSSGKSGYLLAEDMRLTVDPSGRKIRSSACQITNMGDNWAFVSGRGWGHGVGMCQCGTQYLARQGESAREILFYYYPGSQIVHIYDD